LRNPSLTALAGGAEGGALDDAKKDLDPLLMRRCRIFWGSMSNGKAPRSSDALPPPAEEAASVEEERLRRWPDWENEVAALPVEDLEEEAAMVVLAGLDKRLSAMSIGIQLKWKENGRN
jgi:hypothetical protein